MILALPWQLSAAVSSQTASVSATAQDSVTQAIVKNPLPGFVGRVFQVLFNLPQWLQWSLIALGIVVGIAVVVLLYVRQAPLGAWLGRRSRVYKIGLAGVASVMLLAAGGSGYAGWHYTQHNNDFCIGCHVMGDAWDAFQRSEHRKLECHNCHQQSIFASMRQLYFWVAERPQEIPKHAKVPTNVCSECHVQSVADSSWKRIIATAGHRLHFKSDSSALKNVQCVTCHGQEVHRFKPVDKTCGQTNCHASKDTKIVLGKMAGQTSQHCTGCHTFTRPVPENISMDSTRKFLVANGSPESCFGCHQMKDKLKGFEPRLDRGHNGVCGSCHNPHVQTDTKLAFKSCATNGCHADLASKSAFHATKSVHSRATCGACHQAHEWKPVGRECIDCHKGIFNPPKGKQSPASQGGDAGPSVPETLRPIVHQPRWDRNPATTERTGRGRRVGVSHRVYHHANHGERSPRAQARVVRVRQQSGTAGQRTAPAQLPSKDNAAFSHRIHKVLACAGCHDQKAAPGRVSVRTPSDCAACHHSPERSVSCEGCHNTSEHQSKVFQSTVAFRLGANAAPINRRLAFTHQMHRDLTCKGCHTSGILLGVTHTCQSCHTDHHVVDRTCTTCHQAPAKGVHQRTAHEGCAGSQCHSNAAVLAMPPTRQVCLSCHTDQKNHKPRRECSDCHAVKWGSAPGPSR